ncbi:hypothetical protein [Novosphingobium sp. BL-52-GroH]|uniref:hypothetical protein n=1 Tax=Novosphingobium sp. BL-52-GroH TaxID=3349877 RepID=UPI00384FA5C2
MASMADVLPHPPGLAAQQDVWEPSHRPQFVLLFPTHLASDQVHVAERLVMLAAALERAPRASDLLLCIAVQYRDAASRAAAVEFASRLEDAVRLSGLHVVKVALESRLKVDSINWAWASIARDRATWLGWIDDDVHVEPGGVTALINACEAAPLDVVAVGLNKRAQTRPTLTSRILKERREALGALRYPHGCCVCVRSSAGLLPIPRDVSDDGWIAAKLVTLDPADPFSRAIVLKEPRVCYWTCPDFRTQLVRIRRIYIDSYIILLKHLSPEHRKVFMEQVLFRRRSGMTVKQVLLWPISQGVPRLMWLSLGASIWARARLNRPMKWPAWS